MRNVSDISCPTARMPVLRSGRFLLIATLASIAFTIAQISALGAAKKNVNCLDKIVVFRDEQKILGAGFITVVDGKKVAASFSSSLSANMKIFDLNDQNLPYDALIIPVDKDVSRNLIFYKLTAQDSGPAPMQTENDILGSTSIGHKIFVFGCVPGSKTITQDKGKILGIGPHNIETNSNIPTDIEGGPLVSAESEKALGIIRCQKRVIKKKEGFVPYAVRFDNIEEFKEYSLDKIKGELTTLCKISEFIAKKETLLSNYSKDLQDFQNNITDPTTVSLVKINDLDLKLTSIQRDIASLQNTLASMTSKLNVPQLKSIAETRINSLLSLKDKIQSAVESIKMLRNQYHDPQNTKKRDKKINI